MSGLGLSSPTSGLAVEAFVVEWGASTKAYDDANKHIRDEAKKTATHR